MQVNRMLHKHQLGTGSEITNKSTTYRSAKSTTRNGELNALIPFKAVDIT